jgi:GGDEF domain-containing protein
MADVDHFKRFNDRYGHDVGDQVLKMLAAWLAKAGGGGKAFRYGGEEFTLIFAGKTAEEATPQLEPEREAIAASEFTVRGKDRPRRKPKQSTPVTTHPAWAICSGRRRKYVLVGLALASLPKTLAPQIAHAGFLWHG